MVGHKFATGNIRKTKACKLRTAILNSISEEAVQEIVMAVIDLAAKGDLAAAKLIFQTIGRPTRVTYLRQHAQSRKICPMSSLRLMSV